MATLDKTKSYGTVIGCPYGREYVQNGVHFDGDGKEVVITASMRAENARREAQAAADGGDDKDAALAAMLSQIADLTARLEAKEGKVEAVDARDAKIEQAKKDLADLSAKAGGTLKLPAKPADQKSEVDKQLEKQQ